MQSVYVYYVDFRYGIVRSFVDIYNKDGKRVKPGTFGTDHTILKRAVDEIPELVAIVDDQSLTFEEKIVLVLSKYDNDYLKK